MATSGNFTTNNTGRNPPQMIFEWWRTGWGRSGGVGYHNISYHLKSYGGTTTAWSYLYNGSMSVDGTGYSWGTTQFFGAGRTSFGDYSKTLYTDSSGNRSFGASAQGGIYTAAINTSGSGSWALDNIPMYAVITGHSGTITDETSNVYISYSNPVGGSVTARLYVRPLGSTGGFTNFANRSGYASGANFNLTNAERDTIRAALSNSTQGQLIYRVENSVGNTDVGWSNETLLNIVNGSPVFTTATYKDANSTTVAVTGNNQYIVQGQSTMELDIASGDKAVAQKQATMSKYNALIGAINQDISYTTSAIAQSLGTVGLAANDNLRVRAIDSRGLYKDVSLAVKILPYAAPQLTATVTRTNNFETACTIHIEGIISRLTIAGTDKNAVNSSTGVQYRAKKTTDANYSGWNSGNWTNVANSTSAGNVSVTDFNQNFDRNYAWNIQIRIVDKLQTTTQEILLPQGIALFRIGLDGRVYNQERPISRFDIGDIYMTTDSSMSTAAAVQGRYGGTWIAWGVGRVPVGVDTGQTEFNTVEKTGGHKLMQAHTHSLGQIVSINPDSTSGLQKEISKASYGEEFTGNYGGGNAQNLQPYTTCYFWKRTA